MSETQYGDYFPSSERTRLELANAELRQRLDDRHKDLQSIMQDRREALQQNEDLRFALANSEAKRKEGELTALRYALQLVDGRRVLNRVPSYIAALDDLKIFLDAAIERVENGEPMTSTATCQ